MKEWKSRIGVDPPAQFFAEVIAYLNRAYPAATLDRAMLKQLRPYLVGQWRIGQNASKAAAATCACDGASIVPSPGSQVDLPRRAALAPKGASRADIFGIEDLREAGMLPKARVQAEIAVRQVEHYRAEMQRLDSRLAEERAAGNEKKSTMRLLSAAQRELAKHAEVAASLNQHVNALVMSAAYVLPGRVTDQRKLLPREPSRRAKKQISESRPVRAAKSSAPKSKEETKTAPERPKRAAPACTTCKGPQKGPETLPSEDQALLEDLVREFAQAGIDELEGNGS